MVWSNALVHNEDKFEHVFGQEAMRSRFVSLECISDGVFIREHLPKKQCLMTPSFSNLGRRGHLKG